MLNVLLVERKSPFEIALLDVAESTRVSHYSLSVTCLETSSIPMKLEILSRSNYTDTDGRLYITGELRNLGDERLVNAKVVATYYDISSHVAAAAYVNFDPEEHIDPNQTFLFEIRLDKERTQFVATYALEAQSNQYVMIMEFPGHLLIALLTAFSSLLLMCNRTKGKKRFQQKGR
jgi:hypothetical protein